MFLVEPDTLDIKIHVLGFLFIKQILADLMAKRQQNKWKEDSCSFVQTC